MAAENLQIAGLISGFVVLLAVFVGMMVFLLFKIIYRNLESKFYRQMKPSSTGIRPISNFLNSDLDSRLEESYDQRRGSIQVRTVNKIQHKNAVQFVV